MAAGALAGTEMMGGAWRTWGTILRGAGGTAGVATATGGLAATGAAGLAGGAAGRAGAWLRRAASSSSCFLARMAFTTSPGLWT